MQNTVFRAIKVRLYPNKAQEQRVNQLLGCCRLVYNKALDEKKKAYDERKESPTDDGSAHAEPPFVGPAEAGSGSTICRNC